MKVMDGVLLGCLQPARSIKGLDKVKATCRELVQVSCWSTEPFMCKRLSMRLPNVKCEKGKEPWKECFHHIEGVWVIASHGGPLGHIDTACVCMCAIPDQRQHTREVSILCFLTGSHTRV